MKQTLKMLSCMLVAVLIAVSFSGCGGTNAEKITIMFNLNGGSQSYEPKTVTVGEKYGELPEPTRGKYTFNGWYTSVSGGRKITSESEIININNHILYAHWTGDSIDVIFDPNGGAFTAFGTLKQNEDGTATKSAQIGDKYGMLPNPQRLRYIFDGWYLNQENTGTRLIANTTITKQSSHKVYAKWVLANTTWTFENGEADLYSIDDSLGVGLIFSIVERGETGNHMLKVDPKDVWQRSNSENPNSWFCSVRFNHIRAMVGDVLAFKMQFELGSTMTPLIVFPLYTIGGDRLGDQNGYSTGVELNSVSITLEHDIDNLRIEVISPSKPDWILYIDDVIITYAK